MAYGVDTLVLNVTYADEHFERSERELDEEMQAELDQLKREITLWMKERGAWVNKRGGGGHWRWILESNLITVAISRGKQDGGVIAQVRCSSESL